MRKVLFLVVVLISCVAAGAAAQTLYGVLNGTNESPGPGDADGFGIAEFRIEGTTIAYGIMVQNLTTPTASHIHRGAAGVAGPVVITLASSFPNNLASGVAAANANLIDEIRRNPTGFYVNVHNADFPNGAIRAQLQQAVGAYTSAQYFPIVGKVDGLNNTKFVADLRIVNPTDAPEPVQLELFHSGPAGGSAPSAIRGLVIGPHTEAVIDDVFASQFSATGLGALKVGTDGGLTSGVRILNDLRPIGQGTTGFFIPPRGLGETATSGVLPFLSQASTADIQAGLGFRSNIGWFNPNLTTAGTTFQARRASDGAVLGSVDVAIAGLSQLQQAVFSLISNVAAGDQVQTDFYVTWTSTIPIHVYAAVVDDKTGDVVYVN